MTGAPLVERCICLVRELLVLRVELHKSRLVAARETRIPDRMQHDRTCWRQHHQFQFISWL